MLINQHKQTNTFTQQRSQNLPLPPIIAQGPLCDAGGRRHERHGPPRAPTCPRLRLESMVLPKKRMEDRPCPQDPHRAAQNANHHQQQQQQHLSCHRNHCQLHGQWLLLPSPCQHLSADHLLTFDKSCSCHVVLHARVANSGGQTNLLVSVDCAHAKLVFCLADQADQHIHTTRQQNLPFC